MATSSSKRASRCLRNLTQSTLVSLELPKIIFGSSALGNLYGIVPDETKLSIVENWIQHQPNPVIDSAGKYGAGLALENIGRCLKKLNIDPADVLISNKLGWKRVPLTAEEPTFEKGAWFGMEYDAEQCISYEGILECYHQGNELRSGLKLGHLCATRAEIELSTSTLARRMSMLNTNDLPPPISIRSV